MYQNDNHILHRERSNKKILNLTFSYNILYFAKKTVSFHMHFEYKSIDASLYNKFVYNLTNYWLKFVKLDFSPYKMCL